MRFVTVMCCLLLAAAVFAQSPTPDPLLGTRTGAFSARSLSLGHTFLTDESGPASLLGNPATLTRQEKPWRIDLSADIARVKETRKYPFYDSFEGILNYNNYAMNDHLYSKLDGGLAWRAPTKLVESLVVSAATYSVYGFDYRYHEEVRNRYYSGGIQDLKLGENRLDVTGDLRSISLGAAAKSFGPTAVGFGVNLLMGEWSYEKGVFYADPDSANIVSHAEYSPNGTPAEVTFGATYEVNPRVMLGVRALVPTGDFKFDQNATNIHGDTVATSTGTVTVTYPSHFAVGVEYRPQSEFRPVLLLEGEIHTYSDVSDLYDNTFEIRAGAEQEVVSGAPVRFGFVYASAPEDKMHARTMFTAGIGFRLQKLAGDFALELGKMNYQAWDMFPQSLYGDTDRTDIDRVETALFRALVTFRYDL